MPIVIIQGAEDYATPVELARAYFDSITAPRKEFVVLANAGHTALVDHDERECREQQTVRSRPRVFRRRHTTIP